jgi:hypothetical protein
MHAAFFPLSPKQYKPDIKKHHDQKTDFQVDFRSCGWEGKSGWKENVRVKSLC